MLTAYLYALYRDKNRKTKFEFMSGDSSAIIPTGTIVPDGAIVPKGAVIPEGTVLPTGAIIPPQTIVPSGLKFNGKIFHPQVDKIDPNTVKIPIGAVIPNGTVIPPNAYIPLNTYIPEGQRINVPPQAIIPKNSIIKEGIIVPNYSIIARDTVIPKYENTEIEIPNGTIIPANSSIPKGTIIPKPLKPTTNITTSDQLKSAYESVYKNSEGLVIGQGTLSLPAGDTIRIVPGTILPDNLSGLVITEGTVIPKTNSINVPKGTYIPGSDPVEPLEWNATFFKKCAEELKNWTLMDYFIWILHIYLLYVGLSIALSSSDNPLMVAAHVIAAMLFAPIYVLLNIVFQTEAFQRYENNKFLLDSERVERIEKHVQQTRNKKYMVSRRYGAY